MLNNSSTLNNNLTQKAIWNEFQIYLDLKETRITANKLHCQQDESELL